MKTWQAILLTLGIILVCELLPWPRMAMVFVVIISSIWAAVDSGEIELNKYKSSIALNPFVLLIGCLGLWIIGFPWYLSIRYKIKHGLAELKDRYKDEGDSKKYIKNNEGMTKESKSIIILLVITALLTIIGIVLLYMLNLQTLGRNVIFISLFGLLPLVVVLSVIFRATGKLPGVRD